MYIKKQMATDTTLAKLFAIAFSLNLNACGQKDYKSDYKSEKERRFASEQQLSDAKSDNSDLKTFLSRMTFTTHYAWIYHGSALMNDGSNSVYTRVHQECQDLGFEVPTLEMAAEAATNPDLKKVMYMENGWRNFVIVDQPVPGNLWIVLCAKKI